jgi:hypothetical protein
MKIRLVRLSLLLQIACVEIRLSAWTSFSMNIMLFRWRRNSERRRSLTSAAAATDIPAAFQPERTEP